MYHVKISKTVTLSYDDKVVIIDKGLQDKFVLSRQEAQRLGKVFLDLGLTK